MTLKDLNGDLQALATELRAAQDAVAQEVGDLTSQLVEAKLALAEREETIERVRREARAPRGQDAIDATADELRATLAAERAKHKQELDDAHARLAEAVPLLLASPGAKKPSKLFSRAVTTTTMLKRRAKNVYKRKKAPQEQSVDQLLRGAPLFASLSLSERGDLADHCIVAEFRNGDVISSTGDYSDQMCLVARGVVILSAEGTEVATVEPGGSFGDDSLMHDLKRSSTATAASDLVRLVCVPRRALRDILRGERDTRSLWDAYRSYEASLLKRLVQDVEAASTRQEYLVALGRHRATASLIPLEPTCKMLQRGGKDARRKQFVVDLRREASLILNGERYPLETEAHFNEFMAVLRGLAQRAATAPASTDAPDPLALPPSLVGFLPYAHQRPMAWGLPTIPARRLLFAEDAECEAKEVRARRDADPAQVEAILLQLLASCSRTTSGGESFARCHELFGSGDVVVLTPSPELTSPTRIRVLRDDLVMLTSTNTYRVQHADEGTVVRGTGYSTWCLLVTSVVEVLDLANADASVRHMSISFYHPSAESAIRRTSERADEEPTSPAPSREEVPL